MENQGQPGFISHKEVAMWRDFLKPKPRAPINASKGRFYEHILFFVLRVQRGWAMFMQHHFERCSRKGKIAILVSLIVCVGGMSAALIFNGMRFKSQRINAEPAINLSMSKLPVGEPTEKQRILKRLEGFTTYLKELEKTKAGIQLRDRILKANPGLMDSIRQYRNLHGGKPIAKRP